MHTGHLCYILITCFLYPLHNELTHMTFIVFKVYFCCGILSNIVNYLSRERVAVYTSFPTIKELLESRSWNANALANYNQLSHFFLHFDHPVSDRYVKPYAHSQTCVPSHRCKHTLAFDTKCVTLIHLVVLTENKSRSGSKQYANLQRTALLYMKGAFYAPLTCSCLYLIPRGRKYPHKYIELSFGWMQEQGTLFLWGNDRFSLD